jgi:hypothetical protein
VAASWARVSGDSNKEKIRIQSEVRGIGVPPVVRMRLGRLSPARGPEASGWETRFLCSMRGSGAALREVFLFGMSPGVGNGGGAAVDGYLEKKEQRGVRAVP